MLSLLLGRRPARARVGLLVRWCGLFGITENAARVALSRMVERGELAAHDGVYELAGRVRRRQQEQEVALSPPAGEWSGGWHVLVVAGAGHSAAERAARRGALQRAHLAELREGVWTRPDNVELPEHALGGGPLDQWRGAPVGEDPAQLAERLFAVAATGARGALLVDELLAVAEAPDDLARAFVVGAAALQHLRRDPLLPAELVPRPWPGDALRAAYLAYERAFSDAVAAWYRAA